MAEDTTKTYNQDVQVAVRKLDRAIDEMGKSASSRDTDFLEADQVRLKSYLSSFQTFIDYAASQPVPDYAETHTMLFDLPDVPAHDQAENELVQLAMNQLLRVRQELATGQSSRRAAGLHEHDKTRIDDLVKRAQRLITEFIERVNPIDYPASAPAYEVGRDPRSGV